MNICITSGAIQHHDNGTIYTFAETAELLSACGFSEVDYAFTTPSLIKPDWETDFTADLRAADKYGIRFRYTHLPFDYPALTDTAGWEAFQTGSYRAIDLSLLAGADCAAVHPNTRAHTDFDPEYEHSSSLAFLTPYVSKAHSAGLVLALENMRGAGKKAPVEMKRYCTDYRDVLILAKELDIGICWDTGHGNISGQNPMEALTKIGSSLKMIHVNDNTADDDIHILPYTGSTDWNGIIQGLRSIGFTGSINLETGCKRMPDCLVERYLEILRDVALELAKQISKP